nr:11315_t:CDS:2 [Entrophospora candida]
MNQDTNEPLQSLPFNSTLKVAETINMEENMEEEELPDNWGGMLHLPKSTFCIVSNNISMILIRKSYLQMIEQLEKDAKNGCAIVGTPGIGKTFFGLYFLFYITCRYPDSKIIWETIDSMWYVFFPDLHVESGIQRIGSCFYDTLFDEKAFYLVDSIVPVNNVIAYTLLFSSPRQERWNEFIKQEDVTLYYSPIWTPDEIWILWREQWKEKMTADRVQELMDRWGPIPRTIFDKRDNEPNFED